MTILKAHFASGAEFVEHYLPALPCGGIFFPTRRPLAIGEPVVVSIRMGKRRSPMLLRGHVVWRRPGKHRTKTKAGIGIEFLISETQTRDYLVAVARGDSAEMIARRHQRLPVELPVTWQVPGALQDNSGVLRDIGRGGAFVKTEQMLPADTDVVLKVSPPGAEVAMPLSARVAWKGQPGGEHGFGVEWKARDAGGNRRIKELVRRIESMGGFSEAGATTG
ncbi:MAG TPA: PilZ domain-containing protein [Polyangia bacterium]|jgi:Tfp pilus assembly protein PilZ|nr:PilZ domain-containing protein [Polyangia bacterium]